MRHLAQQLQDARRIGDQETVKDLEKEVERGNRRIVAAALRGIDLLGKDDKTATPMNR